MQHGQNQRWDIITLTLHNNLGNLLPSTVSSTEILEARLSSKPASGWHTHPVPHPSCSCNNIYQHVSQHLQTQHTILDIEGIRGSCSLGQGQNSSSPLWKNLVKLILYYRAQWYKSIFGNSPFNQIPNLEYSPMWPLKELPNLQKYFGIVMQNNLQWTFCLFFLFKCIWHMSEHHHWRHICSLQNLFYTFITQYQHSKHALFFPCNVFLIFSNFSLLLNLILMHRYIQNMHYVPYNLFHKLFNLALHCLYLFIRISC